MIRIVSSRWWVLGILAALLVPGTAFAAAQIQASRTSGVAPLLVVFDATGSTAPSSKDAFHDMYFHWDFDDAGAGNWAHSATPKTEAQGPIAAHVFESPGTYQVRVDSADPGGNTSSASVTITVQDPNSVFSGSKTTCVSARGDFAGCPSGAAKVTTSSFSNAVSYAKPGQRVLLRRGDSFSGNAQLAPSGGPGILGAYGTGADPLVTSNAKSPTLRISKGGTNTDDWRVMDLHLKGSDVQYAAGISAGGYATRILLMRVHVQNHHTGIDFNWRVPNSNNKPSVFDQIGIVESRVEIMKGGSGGNGAYIAAKRLAILGNVFRDAIQAEHLIRLTYGERAVIQANFFELSADKKHHLKVHGMDRAKSYSFSERDSHYIVVNENTFLGGIGGWVTTFGPQNDLVDERVRDILVERNTYRTTSALPAPWKHIVMSSIQNATVRHNRFEQEERVISKNSGSAPPAGNIQVYSNCLYPTACGMYVAGGSSSGGGSTQPPPPAQPPAAPILLP